MSNKLAATFFPQAAPAKSHPYVCEWCSHVWTSPISAVLCCDETSNALHSE